MLSFVLVFNYSTNIIKITDIKKSRGNYFAKTLLYPTSNILYNSWDEVTWAAIYVAPMALTA